MDESKLLLYVEGLLAEDDCCEVEAWAEASAENRKELDRIYYMSQVDKRVQAYETANVERALDNFRKRLSMAEEASQQRIKPAISMKLRSAWRKYGMAVAAFVAGIVLTGGILLGIYGGNQQYEVSTAIGQRARVLLPDGTAVWLNSQSQLAYESGWLADERKVELSGEAFFDVKRNERKPFVVESQGVRTKVLGTKFNVRARNYEDMVVTTLLKGAVQIYCCEEDGKGHCLQPGQTMAVNTETHDVELRAYNNPEEVLLWIKGDLRFSDCTLAEIAATLSKVYNVRFKFSNEALKQERFTCEFRTDALLDDVMHTLSLTKHFGYHIVGNEVCINPIAED